eukprot:CAMPEP_0119037778 /NCGR_PEP_ID=MMETSP1177-20130426/6280_1 /TAXON_ID=2985 /ORGANISM="Ochromonas sp, Strain CCMP1899" /LENGTH=716 /DNA_ID=CAMNT_0006999457 /DNA_START=272 /DNA_END=2422 /DNA_ORIENTATION=-
MGSMHTGLEESGGFFTAGKLDDMAEYFAERARGGVGLMVTGGIAPNNAGRTLYGAGKMNTIDESNRHKLVTQAVHDNDGRICMQILHTGRYGYHHSVVSASAVKSPIGWFTPTALSSAGVEETITDYVKCAEFARKAGYDGIEIMGSEGYLINQFLVNKTNKRTDEYGGSYSNRMRFATEIVSRTRKALGPDFIIIYRLSMLDLVEDGSTWAEVVELAHRIEAAGATIINTGIGWHEARIPTIATMVPRGGFSWVTAKMKKEINIPLCTTNRINAPETAEDILSSGSADLISMARPFLADPFFMNKASEGKAEEINTCIGCNQACLDHTFSGKHASCLVNPRAGHETSLIINPTLPGKQQHLAVVGAGPAGLAFATTAASRGHKVTLFDKESQIGGQFNMAKRIPGKEEFYETLRYFNKQIALTGVDLKLNTPVTVETLKGYDAVILATGVLPRQVKIPLASNIVEGKGRVNVVSYVDVLKNNAFVGERVAVIGAGGIGFDVSDFLTHVHDDKHTEEGGPLPMVDEAAVNAYIKDWGIDTSINTGGVFKKEKKDKTAKISINPDSEKAARKVFLLQRKKGKIGAGLGKTTGWIHRMVMKKRGVEEMDGCKYIEVNDQGLVIERGAGKRMTLEVDTIVICAGQVCHNELYAPIEKAGSRVFLIGGSQEAGELDAKRAIDQGTRLAAVIEDAKTGEVFEAPVAQNYKILKFVQKMMGN